MQLNIRALKAVALMASKERTRYYLNGVYIEFHANHLVMVATDGHCLAAVRQTLDAPLPAPPAGVIIPLDLIARIKPSKVEPLAHAELSVTGARVTIDYLGDTFAANAIDGTFPDWRRVAPASVSGVAAQFNPALPARFAAAARVFSSKPSVFSIGHNGLASALVDWVPADAGAGLEGFGVIMPWYRKQAPMTAPPAWATTAPGATS
jgi:hypothetical protein